MKKLLKVVYERISKKREKHYVACLSKYLSSGEWYFTLFYNKIKPISIFAWLPWNIRHRFKAYGDGPDQTAYLASGSGKVIVIYDEYAIGLFYSRKQFQKARDNCYLYYDKLSYPLLEKPQYFEELLMVKMKRVMGNCYYDESHTSKVLANLIELHKGTPVIGTFFIQHGDVQPNNIVWNDNKVLFIDLDGIGLYPAFFDVLHYMNCLKWSLEMVLSFFRDCENDLTFVLSRIGISGRFEEKMDYVFEKFVDFYDENCRSIGEISFLLDCDKNDYFNTYRAVERLKAHIMELPVV